MDVPQTLFDLCLTYRVSSAFGDRLRPLLERAAQSPPEKQQRLLELVERSFAEESVRTKRTPWKRGLTALERKSLLTVAQTLHDWKSPTWLKVWESQLRFD